MTRRSPILLSLLPVVAGAQSLPYRPVETPDPAVPDGSVLALDLTNSGWSLLRSRAPNLSAPPRYGVQYYFRSPEGTLTRIPVERLGISGFDGFSYSSHQGRIAPDGSFAILQDPHGLIRIDRATMTVRRFPFDRYTLTQNFGLSGDDAFILDDLRGLVRTNTVTGAQTAVPLPLGAATRDSYAVTPDGAKATYKHGDTFFLQTLANGGVRSWSAPTGSTSRMSISGRYVWADVPSAGTAGRRLLWHDLFTGAEESWPFPAGATATLVQLTDRYAFFTTTESLVAADDNGLYDDYALDRTTGAVSLITDRQGSGRAVGGGGYGLYASPNGYRTMFVTAAPGVTDRPSNGFPQLYTRTTARSDTKPALYAAGPGGAVGTSAVLSRNGKCTAWVRPEGEGWTIRIVRDGSPVRTIAVVESPRLLDVTDDGRDVIWRNGNGYSLWRARNGAVSRLDIDGLGFGVQSARIEPKTLTAFVSVRITDNQGRFVSRLVRFDPGSVGGTVVADSIAGYDADAGRLAVGRSARQFEVRDLASGTVQTFDTEANTALSSVRLTSSGLYVAAKLRQVNPFVTRLYRISDGRLLRTYPGGELLPDGQWLVAGGRTLDAGSVIRDLYYIPTGAYLADSLDVSGELDGEAVGPQRLDENPSTTDTMRHLWLYRAVAPKAPTVALRADDYPGGVVYLAASYRKAGLENVETWVETRTDGGAWQRMTELKDVNTSQPTATVKLTLPDGRNRFEARAADALGRTSPVVEAAAIADSVPPTVGAVTTSVRKVGNVYEATVFLATDATQGQLRLGQRSSSTDPYGYLSNPERTRDGLRFTFLMDGADTYTFTSWLADEANNSTDGPTGSVTHPYSPSSLRLDGR